MPAVEGFLAGAGLETRWRGQLSSFIITFFKQKAAIAG
jgi:hypothetical protein